MAIPNRDYIQREVQKHKNNFLRYQKKLDECDEALGAVFRLRNLRIEAPTGAKDIYFLHPGSTYLTELKEAQSKGHIIVHRDEAYMHMNGLPRLIKFLTKMAEQLGIPIT